MTEKTLTTENIKPALDALRGELAPWPVVAMKQDKLNDTQKSAVNSGITSGLVAQIIANTAAIRALESAITGTGLRPLVVASLPAVGTTGILYIVPVTTYDPDTDADVVNYSNEYIWIPVEAGTASEGHYEQVGQTGIVINNGQLTITVNGTSVGTFTANQSGDTTAAITVPTNADYVDRTTAQTAAGVKTFSDGIVGNVTGNVTGDLTGTASKAIADEDGTSIKTGYVNVAGNQTVTGNKDWTGINSFVGLTIKDSVALSNGDYGQALTYRDNQGNRHAYIQPYKNTSGVVNLAIGVANIGAVQLNSSLIPYATNVISLGSSSYQWGSVYAQTYYYNGTQWGLDKANIWSEENSFNSNTNFGSNVMITGDRLRLYDKNDQVSVIPSSSITKNIYFTDKDGTAIAYFSFQHRSDSSEPFRTCWRQQKHNGTNNYYSVNFNNLGKFYPETTDISLGTSTNQWSSVYAQSYYYNGTAWGLDKANVWTGNNRFSKNASLSDVSTYSDNTMAFTANANTIFFNTRGSADYPSFGTFLFAGYASGTAPDRYGQLKLVRSTDIKGATYDGYKPDTSFNLWRVAPHYSLMDFVDAIRVQNDGTNNFIAPITNNATNLGTSSNKWKTLNGINPGALSFPDSSKAIVLDTTNWNVSAGFGNRYTPVSNGWLYINIKDTATNSIYVYAYSQSLYSASVYGNGSQGVTGRLALVMPVLAGVTYEIIIKADSVSEIYTAKFFPCLGNV